MFVLGNNAVKVWFGLREKATCFELWKKSRFGIKNSWKMSWRLVRNRLFVGFLCSVLTCPVSLSVHRGSSPFCAGSRERCRGWPAAADTVWSPLWSPRCPQLHKHTQRNQSHVGVSHLLLWQQFSDSLMTLWFVGKASPRLCNNHVNSRYTQIKVCVYNLQQKTTIFAWVHNFWTQFRGENIKFCVFKGTVHLFFTKRSVNKSFGWTTRLVEMVAKDLQYNLLSKKGHTGVVRLERPGKFKGDNQEGDV